MHFLDGQKVGHASVSMMRGQPASPLRGSSADSCGPRTHSQVLDWFCGLVVGPELQGRSPSGGRDALAGIWQICSPWMS